MPEPNRNDQLRLDALRELGTIGAGRATSALADMTGSRVMIRVPGASIVRVSEIWRHLDLQGRELVVIGLKTLGDLTGNAMLALTTEDAMRLGDLLLERPFGATADLAGMERSSLEEAGNVVVAAYLNALSDFLGVISMPSVPALVVGQAETLVESRGVDIGKPADIVVCVSTHFEFEDCDPPIGGFLLFLPDAPTLKAVLHALELG